MSNPFEIASIWWTQRRPNPLEDKDYYFIQVSALFLIERSECYDLITFPCDNICFHLILSYLVPFALIKPYAPLIFIMHTFSYLLHSIMLNISYKAMNNAIYASYK
jgi:hypothetical protein